MQYNENRGRDDDMQLISIFVSGFRNVYASKLMLEDILSMENPICYMRLILA